MSAEPEVVHRSVPARWDTLEWLWAIVSQKSHFIGDPLPHRKPVLQAKQRPDVGATPALADDSVELKRGMELLVQRPDFF